ncbi:hypothetical protein MRB53_021461 [Persea americana]|uniref:Uncharacterized protein n=1 Tax=Persea americana TaxID=3435 RepID=A0ACC2L531_PERAE|nr:hypothetical protein MRB53_021461 [Persea americana]
MTPLVAPLQPATTPPPHLSNRFCELITMMLLGEEKAPIEVHVTLSPQHVEIDLSKAIVLYQADEHCMDTQDYSH